MRSRPSWRFWLLVLAGAILETAAAVFALLMARASVGPIYLLAVVLVPLGLLRERSLQPMTEQRRRGWALAGGLVAAAISVAFGFAAFLVALGIACEGGC